MHVWFKTTDKEACRTFEKVFLVYKQRKINLD